MSSCRNDCEELFLFPKRPNNRPGLIHIDYRIGTYSDFREAIFRALNKDLLLANWTHRNADDPGIALLEGASILGDILTFYQELYANEAYLRTAHWRESITDLVKLLGYRPSPGTGGKGIFAFEIDGNKPITIPVGFPVKAQLENQEEQAEFQTRKSVTAYPWLSKFHLYRGLVSPNNPGNIKELYIPGNLVEVNEGDRLIIGDPDPLNEPTQLINGEIVIIDGIRELHDRKIFKIEGALKRTGSISKLVGYKLGRSFRHFGYNATNTVNTFSDGFTENQISFKRRLDIDTSSSTLSDSIVKIVEPKLNKYEFPLEHEVDDFPNGINILIKGPTFNSKKDVQQKEFIFIRTVQNVKSTSMTWGNYSGATTKIVLNRDLNVTDQGVEYNSCDIREIQIHETIGPLFPLKADLEETTEKKGKTLYFFGNHLQAQSLKKRQLAFVKSEELLFQAGVVSVQSLPFGVTDHPLLRKVVLDKTIDYDDFPNENPQVTVYGNLVGANQGKTEDETTLGNGDSRQRFQTFKIPKSPLTYHKQQDETPPEVPELQIYVNDRLWQRVPSFFGHGADEEIYIVREDSEGNSWVQFGDGKTGSRLPSGVKNVVVQFRTGTGAYGTLKEETTVQAGDKLNRLDKIQLPGIISGGDERESKENVREAAPGKIQSLDRLVSLKDFESETLALSGVSKAMAAWDLIDNVPGVVITVLIETGRDKEIREVRKILSNYNRCRGPQRFPVKVVQGKIKYVYLDVVYGLEPTFRKEMIENEIKEAIGVTGDEGSGIDGSRGLFGIRNRCFGQDEYATRIAGTVQNVEGVLWAKVTTLGFLGEAEKPAELGLPTPKTRSKKVSCDNFHILNLFTKHLNITDTEADNTITC